MVSRILLLCLLSTVGAALPASAAELLPVEHFARLPAIGGPSRTTDVVLSPDGSRLAAIISYKGEPALASIPTDGSTNVKFTYYGDYQPLGLRWATNRHILLTFAFPTTRGGIATTETRVAVFDTDSGQVANLIGYRDAHELEAPLHVSQFQSQIVSRLPVSGDEVLVALDREEPGLPSIYSFGLEGNTPGNRVQKYRPGIQHWRQDAAGVVRFGYGYQRQRERRLLPEMRMVFRASAEEDFRTLAKFDPRDLGGDGFLVFSFTEDPFVMLIADLNEHGRLAVYKFDTRTSTVTETVFSHAKYDVGWVTYAPGTDRLVSVSYLADAPTTVFLDEAEKRDQATLEKLYPGLQTGVVGRDLSGAKVVVKTESASSPPAYYYFDVAKNVYKPLGSAYPQLSGLAIAETRPISYDARDGLEIDGYLTVPKGAEARNLPLIVYPHGGPASRDFLRFDYWVQYFASRGWAVLQMNFRGSEGYGRAFEKAGEHQWGKAMQDDITDGVRWAVEQGIADPGRICIVGGSYGGYAALQGLTSTPGLYRCAVSLNGVSDIQAFISDKRYYASYQLVRDYLAQEDPAAVSPANHAANVEAPVLIVHGTKDRTVDHDQSERMIAALRKAGKPVVAAELEGGDHFLTHERHRIQFFKAMDAFLQEHLGLGPVPDIQSAGR